MYVDGDMDFGIAETTNAANDVVSTNVFDAGAAKLVFTSARPMHVWYNLIWTVGTGTLTYHLALRGADDAALTTNPIIIASSGTVTTEDDGTVLTSSSDIENYFAIPIQKVAKRYYGLWLTGGGTTFTINGDAKVVYDSQTNLIGKQAAVPAT